MIDETRLIACAADLAAPLVCGAMTTCTLKLTVHTALARQARIRFYFTQSPYYDQPPDYGLSAKGFVFYHRVHFQTSDPQGIGYLTATAASGQPVVIELEKGRCYFTLYCPDGLPAGDQVTVVIGDRSAGGPGIEVVHHPTYGDWQLLCTVDRLGVGNFVEQNDMPTLRVVSAPPSQLLVHLPSQTPLNVASDLQISVLDRYGNHVEGYAGRFQAAVEDAGHTTTDFVIEPADGGSKRFTGGVVFTQPGVQRIQVTTVDQASVPLVGRSNPSVCQAEPLAYKLLWADLHGHTWGTDGAHSPAFYYHYGRTVGFLDICALTEHDTISQAVWQELVATAERYNAPHRYTTFLGYEWTGDLAQSLNVLFRAGVGHYYPAYDAASRHYADFVGLLARDGDALLMRHDLPGLGKRWPVVDPTGQMERLVQIYSFMLSSEAPGLPYTRGVIDEGSSVQAALAAGLRFGFLGSSDTHATMPGRRQSLTKGTPGYGSRPYGLTGIYACENTREAVFDALYHRRCYAATDRILLDFRINGHWMGEEIKVDGPRAIEAQVVGTAPFAYVAILKNNRIIHQTGAGATEVQFSLTDQTDLTPGDFYYLRVVQSNGDLAWSSPIWVDAPT
ncbi:MAG: DUF3604 domain-containing protein [Caldilinea sp. CFX5]|nr:DUF3604 domain-containing protein [Caldilinea sp. CFX5]